MALYLLHYAREGDIRPEITIYEPRHFEGLGPKGCKGCAGILSISLLRNLGELGMTVPEGIIQRKIERYTVHSPYTTLSISNPEKEPQILSIYRGGGPRLSQYEEPISFDGWLLEEARRRGARIVSQAVSRIYLEPEAAVEAAGERQGYDLVVLATGVNARPVPILGLEYVPPKTLKMAQDELYVGTAEVEARLGNTARVFLMPRSGLIFGTLVPKGPFVGVSILSRGKNAVSVADFLKHDTVHSRLPGHYQRACGCQPRIAVSAARNYYADRFVAVGDAAVSRLYKDGIGSALLTARQAARTVVHHGLSRRDFVRYYRPLCRRLDRDNRWGRWLFWMNDKVKDSAAFLLAQHRLIADEQKNVKGSLPFTRAAWGMFTGSYSYRSIAWMTLNPVSLIRILAGVLREGIRILLRKEVTGPRKLHVGGRQILILGSGFGGTYTLRHLVPSLNRNEHIEITMVSEQNYFLFSPLLHEVATARIETRHIAYPIRRLHWRDRFNFIQASVEKIDLKERKVITSAGALDYDYLVLALGSVTDVPASVSGRGKVFLLKTLHDCMLIKNHIIEVFEQASTEKDLESQRRLLTFVVCGAGYTGVQLVTELRDFIYKHLVRFYHAIDPAAIHIILVEAEHKIVRNLHIKLGAYVMKQLQKMNIEVRLGSRVTRVREDNVQINGVESVPACTVIWVAGVVANPLIAGLDAATDNLGRVLVDEYLEVPEARRVYAIGDCAHFKDPASGQPVPPRAHTSVRQARVAAHNILADIRG
ncbi:MAG: FAD-dependent oxidoreductase, partial [Chloroflexota bacterium]